MSEISTSSKWTAVVACLAVWGVFCVPFWLLVVGFAGEFVLPTVTFQPTDEFLFSLIFCLFFYGLLLVAGGMAWSAVSDDLQDRNKKIEETDDINAAN